MFTMNYIIITAKSVDELPPKINAKMAEGYIPLGGVAIGKYNETLFFYQSLLLDRPGLPEVDDSTKSDLIRQAEETIAEREASKVHAANFPAPTPTLPPGTPTPRDPAEIALAAQIAPKPLSGPAK